MEIARKTAKSGKVYRIWEDSGVFSMYTIEFLKMYHYNDGTSCNCWMPAYEPKQKIFTSITDVRQAFEDFLNN